MTGYPQPRARPDPLPQGRTAWRHRVLARRRPLGPAGTKHLALAGRPVLAGPRDRAVLGPVAPDRQARAHRAAGRQALAGLGLVDLRPAGLCLVDRNLVDRGLVDWGLAGLRLAGRGLGDRGLVGLCPVALGPADRVGVPADPIPRRIGRDPTVPVVVPDPLGAAPDRRARAVLPVEDRQDRAAYSAAVSSRAAHPQAARPDRSHPARRSSPAAPASRWSAHPPNSPSASPRSYPRLRLRLRLPSAHRSGTSRSPQRRPAYRSASHLLPQQHRLSRLRVLLRRFPLRWSLIRRNLLRWPPPLRCRWLRTSVRWALRLRCRWLRTLLSVRRLPREAQPSGCRMRYQQLRTLLSCPTRSRCPHSRQQSGRPSVPGRGPRSNQLRLRCLPWSWHRPGHACQSCHRRSTSSHDPTLRRIGRSPRPHQPRLRLRPLRLHRSRLRLPRLHQLCLRLPPRLCLPRLRLTCSCQLHLLCLCLPLRRRPPLPRRPLRVRLCRSARIHRRTPHPTPLRERPWSSRRSARRPESISPGSHPISACDHPLSPRAPRRGSARESASRSSARPVRPGRSPARLEVRGSNHLAGHAGSRRATLSTARPTANPAHCSTRVLSAVHRLAANPARVPLADHLAVANRPARSARNPLGVHRFAANQGRRSGRVRLVRRPAANRAHRPGPRLVAPLAPNMVAHQAH